MPGFTDDGYDPRTEDDIFDTYLTEIDNEYSDDLEPYEGSFGRAMFRAFARAVAENQEQDLDVLYDSMFVVLASGEELTELARGYGVQRQDAVKATGVVTFTRSGLSGTSTVPSGTVVTTERPDPVEFVTTESVTFQSSNTTVDANIEASDGDTEGNVGADRITRMPSPPANVLSVTNAEPTGDPQYTLTDGSTALTTGQDRETDESLKERVLEGGSIGGSATVRAVRDKIRGLEGTPSLTIYTNRETTTQNSLPPLSSELVIHAPSVTDADVAQAIHDIVSVTAHLTSGVNGTAVTHNISSDVLPQDRTIEWSTPTEVTLEITLDVVTTSTYEGDDVVKDTIVEYVGGTDTNGGTVAGLDVSEDVIVDELERRVNSITGVTGTATVTIDSNSDGSDDTTTRSDGLTALEIADDEVATVDAANITVN